MHKLLMIVPVVASAYAFQAQAQQLDGAYTGTAGQWKIDLTVKGDRGDLTMACGSNVMFGKATIAPDGAVSGSVKSGTQLHGNITGGVEIAAGGNCGNGKAVLVKK
jgi:hypothetical protein